MRSYRIGSAFGIPLRVDLTFLLVLPLFAYLIGAQVGRYVGPLNTMAAVVGGPTLSVEVLQAGSMPWILGAIAAVGLFVGVVLHELGHSLVAMRFGFPIESITLWLFGGVAKLSEMPEDWKQELYIALAGPIVSIGIGVLALAGFALLPALGVTGQPLTVAAFVLGFLALMNVALALFNMLPGFPMDGGRVLRALLARTRPYARATKIAAEVGKAFAIVLGLVGLFIGFNIFVVGIAFFIYIGASAEAQQTLMKAAFEGVTVRDIMTPADEVSTVEADTSVNDLVDLMFRERHTGYPVTRSGEVVGLVTLEDAKEVREVERDAYRVEEIMSTDLITVPSDADVMNALEKLQSASVGRLLVMDDEEFVGLLTRTDVMTALSIIQTSGARDPGRANTAAALGPNDLR